MAGMRNVSMFGPNLPGYRYSLLQIEMGNVRFMPQGIYHKHFAAFYLFHCFGSYIVRICNVSKIADAITVNRQLVMHHLYGLKVNIANSKRPAGNRNNIEYRNA